MSWGGTGTEVLRFVWEGLCVWEGKAPAQECTGVVPELRLSTPPLLAPRCCSSTTDHEVHLNDPIAMAKLQEAARTGRLVFGLVSVCCGTVPELLLHLSGPLSLGAVPSFVQLSSLPVPNSPSCAALPPTRSTRG